MLDANFAALQKAGCIQCEPGLREMFFALMKITKNDPCTAGCPAFHSGKCIAYQKYHTYPNKQKTEKERKLKDATAPNNGTGKWAGLSIRRIAMIEKSV